MTEKMTIEKANEIIKFCETGTLTLKIAHLKWAGGNTGYDYAKGFLEGWDARMEFEAERNGRPRERKE